MTDPCFAMSAISPCLCMPHAIPLLAYSFTLSHTLPSLKFLLILYFVSKTSLFKIFFKKKIAPKELILLIKSEILVVMSAYTEVITLL